MASRTWNIQEMTSLEVADVLKETDVILVPTGSNERHGRHLPLGCDTFQAEMIASRAAAKAHVPHTPTVWAGYSPHHMRLPGQGAGTVTLRGETCRRIYYDICRSVIYHGFNKIIFVNYHGSNIKIIDEILRRIRYETGAFVACYQHSLERQISLIKDLVQKETDQETWKTATWHAAEAETSMMLYYNSDFVNMEEAIADWAHAPSWMGEDFEKIDGSPTVSFRGAENIWMPMDHYEYSDTATIGNPRLATVELGEALIERMANHLADFARCVTKMQITVNEDARDWPERAY